MSTIPDPDELARLRERAYGPDADIEADPSAVARLRELEAAAASARAVPSGDPASPAPTGTRAGDGDAHDRASDERPDGSPGASARTPREPVEEQEAPAAAAPPDAAVPAVPRGRRRLRVVGWAASVVAGAVLAAGATWWVSAPHPDAVLTIDVGAEIPDVADESFQGDVVRFTEFYGLVVLGGASQFNRDDEYDCIGLTYSQSGDALDILQTGACAPTGLDPVLDVDVDVIDLPEAFHEALPDAVAARFVRRGDVVEVYVVRDPDLSPPMPA